MVFPVLYNEIVERIKAINPVAYAETRNYTNGKVSMLSPYISRGVISTSYVYNVIRQNYTAKECEAFLKELLWREYFQRLLQHNKNSDREAFYPDTNTKKGIPNAILKAATGIAAIDVAINNLYQSGYMHNHIRMYTSSLCHMAGYNFHSPAQWMYYQLLDGDVASNYSSWQWVYGLLTAKKYIANQENINRFCGTEQQNTFLDKTYEELEGISTITEFEENSIIQFYTILPEKKEVNFNEKPIAIYNSYNLDPIWHKDEDINRVLLLEPSHFSIYPVSEKVMEFILQLAGNINGLQVFTGEYEELKQQFPNHKFIAKEHPLFSYPGAETECREWLAPKIDSQYTSYSKYFKSVKNNYDEYFR
ncbi:FAD-binding domain-containing protein [Flavobacterium sp. MK4S-17]|uniref:FAD-binding domain-containing protein n=1 Tax=Flavobacterium sp. MK4S-17 TaxID=2543737 RepID=UPI001357E272|nr:FAD-binding domain-containing protein [Flavobacterium sp. MK4S-17]